MSSLFRRQKSDTIRLRGVRTKSRAELFEISKTENLTSREVSALTGASLRMLQWWDERGHLSPRHEGHARLWSPELTTIVDRIMALKEVGVKFHTAIRVAKKMDMEIDTVIDAVKLLVTLKVIRRGKNL